MREGEEPADGQGKGGSNKLLQEEYADDIRSLCTPRAAQTELSMLSEHVPRSANSPAKFSAMSSQLTLLQKLPKDLISP